MEFKVDPKSVSMSEMQNLCRIEKELYAKIKGLLDYRYPQISVKCGTKLIKWSGNPVKIIHDANPSLENSYELAEEFSTYLTTRDDIEEMLDKKYTLIIDLKMSRNEKMQQPATTPPTTATKEVESMPEYIPQTPRYTFSQMILDERIKREVFDAVKIIECKDLIYSDWGFSEVDPVPRSILNFYGASGTGKTMCAHAIAHYLGKKLLALNYSEIESKYVGEAPKNLQKAFETAAATDSILFFDEADSFLGKRIENVTQGAEQALNSLRSQMLIQLEEFSGVVLFATNLVTNFDPAFESRILKHIKFELPNLEARAAIIKKMIPSRLPVARPFTDEEYLEASKLIEGFSGREIKGAIMDLILSKADPADRNVVFTIDDLYEALARKMVAKQELKAQEEERIKTKIEKKLKEKAAEAEAMKKLEEREDEENNVCNECNEITEADEADKATN
ncbi:MAG: ATP-binding protein [Lepagella sp.]